MGCRKSLTIAEAPTGDMPLQDAVFCPLTSKIYGTMGPYVVKCNASTGARESVVKVAAPVYGDCRLTYHAATSKLYVCCWNSPNRQWYAPVTQPNRDIFPVDPTTMAVSAGLGMYATYAGSKFSNDSFEGPRWIMSIGNFLYFMYKSSAGVSSFVRVNPTIPAVINTGAANLVFWHEHGCYDGSTWFYVPCPWGPQINKYNASCVYDSACDLTWPTYQPCATAYEPNAGLVYIVCGDGNLLRIDDFGAETVTPINLNNAAVITGSLGNSDPCRIRYRIGDHKLYMPCMTADGVIVYDPALGTGILKTGFVNPVDVVFTDVTDGVPVKAFAVQNSLIGLKEIT